MTAADNMEFQHTEFNPIPKFPIKRKNKKEKKPETPHTPHLGTPNNEY